MNCSAQQCSYIRHMSNSNSRHIKHLRQTFHDTERYFSFWEKWQELK